MRNSFATLSSRNANERIEVIGDKDMGITL